MFKLSFTVEFLRLHTFIKIESEIDVVERVTLRQVAEVAGVSLGTASQALSNKSTVSPETRARVFEAAEATGYKLAIRTSVSTAKRLNTIGMLIKHDNGMPPALNPFYSYVLSGVDHECQRQKEMRDE